MIRKVTAHIYDFAKKCWRVHLNCKHVVYVSADEHSRQVKGRFCPSCPGAELAMMADMKNENELEYQKFAQRLLARSKEDSW